MLVDVIITNIGQYPKVNATVRWPVSGATSDEEGLRNNLLSLLDNSFIKKGKNLTERVLYLLQSYDTFGPISSNYFFEAQKFSNWGSLEDVHNAVHNYVGKGGHMSDTGIAAFDPIFWLHHA